MQSFSCHLKILRELVLQTPGKLISEVNQIVSKINVHPVLMCK